MSKFTDFFKKIGSGIKKAATSVYNAVLKPVGKGVGSVFTNVVNTSNTILKSASTIATAGSGAVEKLAPVLATSVGTLSNTVSVMPKYLLWGGLGLAGALLFTFVIRPNQSVAALSAGAGAITSVAGARLGR